MLRFIMGVIAGGVAVWVWRDELRDFMSQRAHALRTNAANRLQIVRTATESALDTAKAQITSRLHSGQEAIRPSRTDGGDSR